MVTQSTTTAGPAPTAPLMSGRGRLIGALAVLILLTEQTALGFQLIAPALIGVATKFQTTQVIWVITAYTLAGGVLTPMIGKLSDRYGRKRVLVIIALISVLGSAVAALAPTFGVLLLGRMLSGVSMAFGPVTYALIRDVFPENYRNMSIAITTNGVGVVTIGGPFLAGFVIDHLALSAVFWITGILSLIGAVGTVALVRESPVRSRSRIDVVGAVLLIVALLLVMYGLGELQTWSLLDPRSVGTIGGGLVVLVLWWFWERRTPEPFIDTRILVSRPFATVAFSFSIAVAATTAVSSYLPTLLQTPRALTGGVYGFGASATEVALFLIPAGVGNILGGLIVGALSRRYGYKIFLILGPLLAIGGSLGMGFLRSDAWMPATFYGLLGLAGFVYAAGPGLLMVIAPAAARGVSAGMMGAIAGAIGSAATQAGGLILNRNISGVTNGFPTYTAHGVEMLFVFSAVLSLVAIVVALFIPRREKTVHTAVTDADLEIVDA